MFFSLKSSNFSANVFPGEPVALRLLIIIKYKCLEVYIKLISSENARESRVAHAKRPGKSPAFPMLGTAVPGASPAEPANTHSASVIAFLPGNGRGWSDRLSR